MSPQIILASTSRYRRELLLRLITDIQIQSPNIDERSFDHLSLRPEQLASRLAFEKSAAVARMHPEAVVIGSDQLVDLDNLVLGKPGNEHDAVSQLLKMAGKWHRLLTAVCIHVRQKPVEFLDETRLLMRPLSEEEAIRYVHHDQPQDCAGSYRIEHQGIALFEKIETNDFTAIMGLPLIRLAQALRECGVPVP